MAEGALDVVLGAAHDDGYVRVVQHVVGHAAQHGSPQGPEAATAHDDDIRLHVPRSLQDALLRLLAQQHLHLTSHLPAYTTRKKTLVCFL